MANIKELPDTLTPPFQTQEVKNPEFKLPWGRLYSCLRGLKSVDLVEDCISLGRDPSCSIVVCSNNFPRSIELTISKWHFRIHRDQYTDLVYLKDLSKNGTFINSSLVGKGNRYILQHDDVLSVGPGGSQKLFIFKNMNNDDGDKHLALELRKKYKVSRFLGKGAFGEVFLIFDKITTKAYALKKLKYSSPPDETESIDFVNSKTVATEVKILKSLSHPCVIKMRDFIQTKEYVFLILEYMAGGDLSKRIHSNLLESENDVKLLFYQIADAVRYLHNFGITHRDLKPDNILLATNAKETLIKITDFGLSKLKHSWMDTICGTPTYVAPEVIDNSCTAYSKKVDVWSIGVILFYMLSKELPFRSIDRAILNRLILKGTYKMNHSKWSGITPSAKELVVKMLIVNADERFDMNKVWEHQWLKKDMLIQYKVNQLINSDNHNSDYFIDTSEFSDHEPQQKRPKLLET